MVLLRPVHWKVLLGNKNSSIASLRKPLFGIFIFRSVRIMSPHTIKNVWSLDMSLQNPAFCMTTWRSFYVWTLLALETSFSYMFHDHLSLEHLNTASSNSWSRFGWIAELIRSMFYEKLKCWLSVDTLVHLFSFLCFQIISARFPWVRFGTVHKKINLQEATLAWEHERYGMKRIPGFTLSHIENPKSELRGSILDTMWEEPYKCFQKFRKFHSGTSVRCSQWISHSIPPRYKNSILAW